MSVGGADRERSTSIVTSLRGSATTTDIFSTGVVGDTNDRFVINADGKLEWGPGNAALDTDLFRSASGQLKTSGILNAGQEVYARAGGAALVGIGAMGPGAEAGVAFGSAGDTNLYRAAANQLQTDDQLLSSLDIRARVGNAGETVIGLYGPGGESAIRFGSAGDTNLYRTAADRLRTSDRFDIDLDLYVRLGSVGGQVKAGAAGPSSEAGLTFGSAEDTNLYRSAADTLRTSDNFEAAGYVRASGLLQANSGGATQVTVGTVGGSGISFVTGAAMGGANAVMGFSMGSGAPNNANGNNGDVYVRQDGGALSTIYQRRAGAWVGIL
jgi:hypothetical protein